MEELFKAVFAIAIFMTACGLLRLSMLEWLNLRLRIALGSFMALLLLPLSYLYLRLAAAPVAASILPLQSLAIWVYGPLLLVILHLVTNRRLHGWHVPLYGVPLIGAVTTRLVFHGYGWPMPAWFELLTFAQGSVFAIVAVAWTLRMRAQLRVVLRGFSGSSYGALFYLSAGLLSLLLVDFFVHWRLYVGRPLSLLTFYLLVTPSILYVLIASMTIIWRRIEDAAAVEDLAIATPIPAPDLPEIFTPVRNLELSPAAAQELARHLSSLMSEQRLYTRNDLTLADLAAELRVSTHLTSELLNAHLHTTFYELLNRHRADEVARSLREAQGRMSITDIAYQAGFNNLNTFYREFKRAHGVTPARYRRAHSGALPDSESSGHP